MDFNDTSISHAKSKSACSDVGYKLIEIPKKSVDDRVDFILGQTKSIVND